MLVRLRTLILIMLKNTIVGRINAGIPQVFELKTAAWAFLDQLLRLQRLIYIASS